MNESLFFFVVAIGVSSGVLFRRQQMTQVEAATLVLGRLGLGVILAHYVPESLNAAMYMVLGAHEAARALEFVIAFCVDKGLAKWEAAKWLRDRRNLGTSFVTRLRQLVSGS